MITITVIDQSGTIESQDVCDWSPCMGEESVFAFAIAPYSDFTWMVQGE